MAGEDVLRLHPQLLSPARTVPVSAAEELLQRLAATEEIVRPDARACSRTAAASRTGSRTVNTVSSSGTWTRPDSAARAT